MSKKQNEPYSQLAIALTFWFGFILLILDSALAICGLIVWDLDMSLTWVRHTYSAGAFLFLAGYMEEYNKVIKLEQELAELSALRLLHSLTNPQGVT